MAEKRIVKLSHPVLGATNEMTDTLVFPDPMDVTLGQLGVLDEAEGEMSKTAYLIHALANIPLASAKDIRWPDLKKVNEALEGFLS